ncbi:MAG TPA: hypothetical protein VG602_02965 [Actinomycetota bacterium]|nr:hypothetical protein [Actinomycetota bacterium]
MRRATKTAIIVLAVTALPAIPAIGIGFEGIAEPSGTTGTAETQSEGPIEHVANLKYAGGSDLEFVTKTVSVCAPDGTCQPEQRDYAIAGVLSQPAKVIDITNPRTPVEVATLPCAMNQNDIQIWGNLVLQSADSTSGSCRRPDGSKTTATIGISDISDPRSPKLVGTLKENRGAHNATVHPTQPIVYISDSDLANTDGNGAQIHIWDFTDPTKPVKVQSWSYFPQHSPHDITFNAAGTRAYAASISHTDIINTENPKAPSLVSVIANEGISISHQADPTPDGRFLLVADELGGGSAPTLSPGGPVHIYDISNELRPVKVGAFGNDATGANGTSTSHVFRINPDGTTAAIAWYNDGVHVVDWSGAYGLNAAGTGANSNVGPYVIASMKLADADTWSAKMWQERHPGFVFANDMGRGFDVFYVPSLAPPVFATGTIVGGSAATYYGGTNALRTEIEGSCSASPKTQGTDGWVEALPPGVSDGTYQVTADGKPIQGHPQAVDLDLYLYDASCKLLAADEDSGVSETADIPEGAKYVVVANFRAGPARISLSVAKAPAI